jgi:H+/Cl- antiporter ClcA
MPPLAKAIAGATIGGLVGLYVSNQFFDSRAWWLILLLCLLGGVLGVIFLGK